MSNHWKQILADPSDTPLRVAIVIAHADDETVGAGGILPQLGQVHLLCVTDGAPRDLQFTRAAGCATRHEYKALRKNELLAAMRVAGLSGDRVVLLEFVDQETSLQMAQVARTLARELARVRPDVVITHAYEGGHPDHDSIALAVRAAQRLLKRGENIVFDVAEMTSYFHHDGNMITGQFIDNALGDVVTVDLTARQRALKRQLLDCYRSQELTLSAFAVEHEKYRLAPEYNFLQPPHAGRLWYEHFDWGMTGHEWRRLAAEAFQQLNL